MTSSHSKTPIFILAGGYGTRLSEETEIKPKPMIEIGGIPILLHIMRLYYAHGFNDFVICAGYRAWEIKDYFLNYDYRLNHVGLDHREELSSKPYVIGRNKVQERWRVQIIDTGLDTMTGARIARAYDEITAREPFDNFGVTYGDGLTDASLSDVFTFHQSHGKTGTLLAVPPVSRFGELILNESDHYPAVSHFVEKPENRSGLINGGFMFFKSSFREYLTTSESCVLERHPLETLSQKGELIAKPYRGFWFAMDTLREKKHLQTLWDHASNNGKIPWINSK